MFCFILFNRFSTNLELSKHIKKHLSTKRYSPFLKFKVCYYLKNKLFFKNYKLFKLRHMKWRFYDRILFFNFLNVNIKKRFYSFGLYCSSFLKNSYGVRLKTKLFKSLFLKHNLFLNRLDIVLWQSGFGFSLNLIRQLIFHGFFLVNNSCVYSCNYFLKKGDIITISRKFDYYECDPLLKTNFYPFTKFHFFKFFYKIMSKVYKKQLKINFKYYKLNGDFIRVCRDFYLSYLSSFSLVFLFFYNYFYGFILKLISSCYFLVKCCSFKILKKVFNVFIKVILNNSIYVSFCYNHINRYKKKKYYLFLFIKSFSFLLSLMTYDSMLVNRIKKFEKLSKVYKFKKSKKLLQYIYLSKFRKNFLNVFYLSDYFVSFTFSFLFRDFFLFWHYFYKFSFIFCLKRKFSKYIIYGCSIFGRISIFKDKNIIAKNVDNIHKQIMPFLYHDKEIHYSFRRKIRSHFYPYQYFYCYWTIFYSFLQQFYYLKNHYEISKNLTLEQSFSNTLDVNSKDFTALLNSSSFLHTFYSFSLYFKKYINVEIDLSSFRIIFLDLSSNLLKNTMLMQNLIIVFFLRFYQKK